MPLDPFAQAVLEQEARALRTRSARLRPFALLETMVPAANLRPEAQSAIEHQLARGRAEVERGIADYLTWLGQWQFKLSSCIARPRMGPTQRERCGSYGSSIASCGRW